MTLEDLRKSISELATDDIIELLRTRRMARRTVSTKPSKPKKVAERDAFKGLTPELADQLLSILGGSTDDPGETKDS